MAQGHNKFALKGLTPDTLMRLYWEDKLSQPEIARRYGVTQGAVHYWFRKWGIQARSHDDSLILLGKSGRFTGERNPRWNGGRHISGGYVMVRMPEHPKASRRGYVREHILVWEQANGRPLPEGWHVHHRNGIRDDNRPENLEAMTHVAHRRLHMLAQHDRVAALEARVKELTDELAACKKGRQGYEHR